MDKYFELVKRSVLQFKENLVLLIPFGIATAMGLGVLLVIFVEIVMLILSLGEQILTNPLSVLTSMQAMTFVVIFVLIDILLVLIVRAAVTAISIGMYKEVVTKGKPNLDNIGSNCRAYFSKYFGYLMIRLLLFLAPLATCAGIAFICYRINAVLGIVVGVVLLLCFIAFSLLLSLAMFFAEPVIAFGKGSSMAAVRECFGYTKRNVSHVLLSFLALLLFNFAVGMAMLILSLPVQLFEVIGSLGAGFIFAGFAFMLQMLLLVLRIGVNLGASVVSSLFLFNAYRVKK
ncbi:hypothetical protein KY320_01850 [Candidatus Woesearchaeota archaeon]|nr:hypothetical protein [Candidatus Woesearchaeota archaeon]